MVGDGNCFYRAVSVSLYGDQNNYSTLRKSIANFIVSMQTGTSFADFESLRQLAANVSKDGTWAGEDVIVVTANYLQRQIHVYFASVTASPLKYSPQLATLPSTLPILIAFYEPGHYRAVTVARLIGHDSQNSPPDNKSGN